MKTAIMFPGQGSQYPGMMRFLFDNSDQCKHLIAHASEAVQMDIESILFSSNSSLLKKSSFAQVCILTMGYSSYLDFVEKYERNPNYLIGHSLGEITALLASGSLKFEDAIKLVFLRGKLMDEATERIKGSMVAISDLQGEIITDICKAYSCGEQHCVIAAYNGPRQTVLSGHSEVIHALMQDPTVKKSGKAKLLDVAGAFHSPLMKVTEDAFAVQLSKCKIFKPTIPVLSTVDNKFYKNSIDIRRNLNKQLTHPVLWQSGIEKLSEIGVDFYIDVGPNATVRQFVAAQAVNSVNSIERGNIFGLDISSDRDSLTRKMATYRADKLRKLIKICICAKNLNHDIDYENRVMRPFRLVEQIHNDSKVKLISNNQVSLATNLATQVLLGKGHSQTYIENELKNINYEE